MNSKQYPNILIVSHNPLSDSQSNGKTLSSFFKGYPKDKVAQLFLTMENPDYTITDKFYRIQDTEILKCFLKRQKTAGKVIDKNEEDSVVQRKTILHKNKVYLFIRNIFQQRLPLALLFRDILWNMDYWKTDSLKQWLKEQSPDIVFFQSSNSPFLFRIVKWICGELDIPMIMQTTDDYVTLNFSLDPFYFLHVRSIKKWYTWAVEKAHCVVAIGDLMASEYKRRFGGNYLVAMNSVEIEDVAKYQYQGDAIRLLYAGNLGLNRWKVLSLLGHCLAELREENIKGELSIYSIVEPEGKAAEALNLPPYMSFKGRLNQEQLKQAKEASDILVHVEAFDRKNKHITRLSISTKIPEYMQSGRCILAIGPSDVASINYLESNEMAMVVTDPEKGKLKESLRRIIMDEQERIHFADRAREIAVERHSINTIKDMIYDAIIDAVEKNK